MNPLDYLWQVATYVADHPVLTVVGAVVVGLLALTHRAVAR